MRSVRRFFDEGDKVKVTLRFRGREMAHQDIGFNLLQRVKAETAPIAKVEAEPSDGRSADDNGAGAEVSRSGADTPSGRFCGPGFLAGASARGSGNGHDYSADLCRPPPQGARVAETTSVGVIAALSASHMLNDVMQSLAPALYPVFREGAVAHLLPDRRHHLRLPAHRLAAAAAHRLRRRPAADERDPAGRHGLHACRASLLLAFARHLSAAFCCRSR